ncbi:MAG TPA: F0F1 ATP synthase subunit beta, partial [bacterium]
MAKGRVTQVMGPVVDAAFEPGHLPAILNAIKITVPLGDTTRDLICEVQLHLGEGSVRTIAMA